MTGNFRPRDLGAALAACLILFACGDDGGSSGYSGPGGTGATGGGTGGTGGGTAATGGGTGATGGGTGATGGGVSGTPDAQCVTDTLAAPGDVTQACADCLCTQGTGCLDERNKCENDPLCAALNECAVVNNCTGDCCTCGTICDAQGANINAGPCQEEVGQAAVGATPNAFVNGAMIGPACEPGAGTACAASNELGNCATTGKCAGICDPAPVCQ